MRYRTAKFNDGERDIYVVFDTVFEIEIGAFESAKEAQTFRQTRISQDKIYC